MDDIKIIMTKSLRGETIKQVSISTETLQKLQTFHGEEAVKEALFEMHKELNK